LSEEKTVPVRAGALLAFDFGTRRIGVAVGERGTGLAHPLATIATERTSDRFAAVQALIDEWHPEQLVVGLPSHADGTPHAMTALARRFARRLEGRFGLPVVMIDERYSTQAASDLMRESGVSARKQRYTRDQIAAQLLLQAYLDERPAV